ncbi:MAG: Crotonyl-CoA hydratase [Desulfovibrio sp.]
MAYQNILVSIEDGIGVLTINRPEVRNAVDYATWDEIREAVREFGLNDDVKVVIITGAGGKAFASGADIRALQVRTPMEQLNSTLMDTLGVIANLAKPVIAAVDGFALGGGCELSMACDIRVATKKSKFGQPEVGLAIIPGGGGTQRLQRLVGIGKAKELIFTGDIISAEEAERIGLVQKVVEDGEDAALAAAKEMAAKIKAKGPVAVSLAKLAINVGANTDLQSGLYLERCCQAFAFSTGDKAEGTTAFVEKRPAQFQGK